MKEMYRHILAAVLVLSLFSVSGCVKDIYPETKPSDGKFVLYTSDFVADWSTPDTKSLAPLNDNLQKQIHNLYWFFYDASGYIEKIYYQDVTPTISLEVKYEDFKDESGATVTPHGKVFIIANAESMNVEGTNSGKPVLVSSDKVQNPAVNSWKQRVPTISEFQKNSLFPVFIEHTEGNQSGNWQIGRPDHILMLGYFDGTISDNTMQIPLGRLAARLRVNLSGPGLGEQARITVQDAPLYTAAFAEEGAVMPILMSDATAVWGDFVETIDNGSSDDNVGDSVGADGYYGGITGTAGNYKSSTYYYCGENNYQFTGVKTVLRVETWDTKAKLDANNHRSDMPDRTYELELGQNSPNITDNRNYSLYRNTSYTFNVTLNKKN